MSAERNNSLAWTTRRLGERGYAALLLAAALLGGCAAASQEAPAGDLPRIGELTPLPDQAEGEAVQVEVFMVTLPVRAWVGGAWEGLHLDAAPWPDEAEHQRLLANGLRVGVLADDQARRLFEQLPGMIGSVWQGAAVGSRLVALETGPLLHGEHAIEVFDRAGDLHPVTLRGGRMQWLTGAEPLAGERVRLTLIPHHHRPHPSLLPRPHHEKILDGLRFDEAALEVELETGRVLVVTMDLPPAGPATPQGGEEDDGQEQPSGPHDPLSPAMPMDPRNTGEGRGTGTGPDGSAPSPPGSPGMGGEGWGEGGEDQRQNIASSRAETPSPSLSPSKGGEGPEAAVAEPSAPTSSQPPPAPGVEARPETQHAQPPAYDRLGHLILGGVHQGRPIQQVLFITARPGRQ